MAQPRSSHSLPFGAAAFSGARPSSPTFSQRSAAETSVANFQGAPERIVSKKDLRASLQAYEDLIASGRAYRNALASISQASAGFAMSIERCARLKGVSDESGSGFLAAGGLHYLIANQEMILEDSLLKTFEQPLSQHVDGYRKKVTERAVAYEKSQIELSKRIRQTEAENIRVGRKRQRDLSSFRAALASLQAQVDELDRVKADYYTQVLEAEEETWDFVLSKVSHVVRSSLDVYERITSKGTDLALEPMLTANPDPFNAYGLPPSDDKMFSILTPLGMPSPALGAGGGSAFEPSSVGAVGAGGPAQPRTPTAVDKVQGWMDRSFDSANGNESGSGNGNGNRADERPALPMPVSSRRGTSPLAVIEEQRSGDEDELEEDVVSPSTSREATPQASRIRSVPPAIEEPTLIEPEPSGDGLNPYFPNIMDEEAPWEARKSPTAEVG